MWNDKRLQFLNLKKQTMQNRLQHGELKQLWIPKLIYSNTKNSDNTHAELDKASVTVTRKGNFTRSGLHIIDEIEMFEGSANPIMMHQSYTKTFECQYDLQAFPFDTQTCAIEVAVGDLDSVQLVPVEAISETGRKVMEYFITDEPTLALKGNSSKAVQFQIVFKRQLIYEAMNTFFPSMLLVIISYCTAFFKLPNFFNTAITVNLTVMLTITTLLISVRSKLPPTSYLKWVEYWLIFAQLVPFIHVIIITSIEWFREMAKGKIVQVIFMCCNILFSRSSRLWMRDRNQTTLNVQMPSTLLSFSTQSV
jgi:hypothetical protein